MKTLIKTSALLFVLSLFSTGVFAATAVAADSSDVVTINALSDDCTLGVSIDKATRGNTWVTIYDDSNNIVMREALSKDSGTLEKAYNFTGLDDGDYTIEVDSNDQITDKQVHIYSDWNDQKLEVSE